MKTVAILTFQNAKNYGAILQCYALQEFIKKEFGANVRVLNYTPNRFKLFFYNPMKPLSAPGIKNKLKAFIKTIVFHNEMKRKSIKHRELDRFVNNNLELTNPIVGFEKGLDYDLFIAGSDQIWNLELINNDTSYLLGFTNRPKISYAASFKVEDVDDYAKNKYLQELPKFDGISVRETNLKDYLKKEIGVESTVVLDPTLLIGDSFWLAFNLKPIVEQKYVLLYYVNEPVGLINKCFEYAKLHNLVVVSLNHLRKEKRHYKDFSHASIEEFLSLVFNASTVFTTSFHGMAFSIVFEKEFYFEVPQSSYNNNARLINLANKLGLESRNISLNKETAVDWNSVKQKLNSEREKSKLFLKKYIVD